jgi:hypothetical protein
VDTGEAAITAGTQMAWRAEQSQRLVALFALGVVLFSVTLLALFDRGTLFGVPLLYIYLFGAWGVLIVMMALVVERSD